MTEMGAMKIINRLMNHSIPVTETGCWIWLASEKRGYGQTFIGSKSAFAHRVSYAQFIGEIPSGMHVCHKCDTPLCINPNHLFLGTPLDNAKDKVAKNRQYRKKRITHCARGHELSPENTYQWVRREGGIMRTCRKCNLIANTRYRLRKFERQARIGETK